MTTPQMTARGIAAAKAYMERLGATIEGETRVAKPGFYVSHVDEAPDKDRCALVLVRVYEHSSEGRKPATIGKRVRQIADADGLRVDVIDILMLAEDRALLRHHRGAYQGTEKTES